MDDELEIYDLLNDLIDDDMWKPRPAAVPPEPKPVQDVVTAFIKSVSNGHLITVQKGNSRKERICTDYSEIGNEIMAALAEFELGK